MSAKKLSLQLYDGYFLPKHFYPYKLFREAVDYKPKDKDLFVVTYPKSGTTWTQYIIYEILTDAEEPPFVNEMWYTLGPQIEQIGAKKLLELPLGLSHRLIKSHMPFQYIPYNSKGKYIYIARNPFEVCLSYYKDVCNSPALIFGEHTFEEWVQLFINGYTAFGDYFDHILSWYKRRNEENILFFTYEELKSNQKEYILKIAEFIGQEFRQKLEKSPELLNKILYYTDFEYMKSIPFILSNNYEVATSTGFDAKKNLDLTKDNMGYKLVEFFNVGKVGYSYEKYSPTQVKQIQDKVNEKFCEIPQLLQTWRSFGVKV